MEFDRLLADVQLFTDLIVGQPFRAAENHLRFAATELVMIDDAVDRQVERRVVRVRENLLREQSHTRSLPADENLLRAENNKDSSSVVVTRDLMAFDT